MLEIRIAVFHGGPDHVGKFPAGHIEIGHKCVALSNLVGQGEDHAGHPLFDTFKRDETKGLMAPRGRVVIWSKRGAA